jgi:hypothetical protein
MTLSVQFRGTNVIQLLPLPISKLSHLPQMKFITQQTLIPHPTFPKLFNNHHSFCVCEPDYSKNFIQEESYNTFHLA